MACGTKDEADVIGGGGGAGGECVGGDLLVTRACKRGNRERVNFMQGSIKLNG